MPNYDFKSLSPADFEDLARALLQEEMKLTFESFVSARDGGIDLRHMSPQGGEIIVQVKHFAGSTYSNLKAAIEKETKKLNNLSNKPKRYILFTSLGLTPARKSELKNILSPFVTSTGDVYGQNDINNLLDKFQHIERRTFKLWITSAGVLQRVLDSGVYTSSEDEAVKIEKTIKLFVDTGALPAALEHLSKYNLLIVSGAPGVGKSTLARALTWHHMSLDWQLIYVASFEEANRLFDRNQKQIFFFDDFMGQIRLTPDTVNKTDESLIRFIERLRSASSTRFVLTSREYIIKQAQIQSEKLASKAIDLRTYTLDIGAYNRSAKAKILYNHIFFSDISFPYRTRLLDDRFYLKMIEHKNFSPRIIEALTNPELIETVSLDNYRQYILEALEKPFLLWQHPYDAHLTRAGRTLVMVLFFGHDKTAVSKLKSRFVQVHSALAKQYNFQFDNIDFEKAVKETEGTFISIVNGEASFPNPSLRDFLDSRLSATDDVLYALKYSGGSEEVEVCVNYIEEHGIGDGISSQKIEDALVEALNLLQSEPQFREVSAKSFLAKSFHKKVVLNGLPVWSRVLLALRVWQMHPTDVVYNAMRACIDLYNDLDTNRYKYSDLVRPFGLLDEEEFDDLPDKQVIISLLERKLVAEILNVEDMITAPDLAAIKAIVDKQDFEQKDNYLETVKSFVQVLFNEIEEDLSYLGYSEDIEDYRGVVQDLAQFAGISYSLIEDKIEEREQELLAKEAERDYDGDLDWAVSVERGDNSDEAINSLFDTLAET